MTHVAHVHKGVYGLGVKRQVFIVKAIVPQPSRDFQISLELVNGIKLVQ